MSTEIKTIEVKKSEVAALKGLGTTKTQIATRLGITVAEVTDAYIAFGITKGKTLKKDYQIKYVDDLTLQFDEADEAVEEFTTEEVDETEAVEY
jgi:hypothetical protein